jgi:hypothetical protein
MSGNRDILMLEFLRRLGAKLDALTADVRELEHRMTRAERQLAASAAAKAVHHATTTVRLDRLEARLDCIERRSEITDRSATE